jgi:oligosaccharide repeat unit polymerase
MNYKVSYYSILLVIHALIAALAVGGSMFVVATGRPEYLLAFLTFPLINLLLLPMTKKGETFDPTHPLLMILVSLMIGTVIRSFYIVSPLQYDTKWLMLMGKTPSIILTGLLAIYIGVIFIVLGFSYPAKPIIMLENYPVFNQPLSLKKFIPVAIIITIISILVAFAFFRKMGVNLEDSSTISKKRHYEVDEGSFSSLGYYRVFMDIVEPVFYVLLVYFIVNKARMFSLLGLFLFVLFFLNMAYPFIVSSRSNAMYVLINVGLINYYLKGGIKTSQLVSILAIASIVLVIMTALRESHAKERSATEVSTNPITIMATSLNFMGVDKTSHIIDRMPEKLPFQFGETLILWILAPIPREMWKGKPEMTEGRVVGEFIYEKRDSNSQGGGVPPGFIAEMYMNFGYIGIVFGSFLFGLGLKLAYNAFKQVRNISILGMVIYILVLMPFSLKTIGGDFSACVVKLFTGFFPIFFIVKLTQDATRSGA